MDFVAFKRSKALLRPVCPSGWNSKGTWVSTARGTQVVITALSCIQPSLHTADAPTRGNFQHSPDQSLKQSPTGEQRKALPTLPLFPQRNSLLSYRASDGPATHPSETEGKVQGSSTPTHAAAALSARRDTGEASRLVPATLNICACTSVCFC